MLRLSMTTALVFAAAAPVSAGTIAAYDTINGVSVAPTIVQPVISASDITRGSGLSQNTGSDFNSRGWDEADLLGAAIGGDFLEWSLSASVTYTLQTLDIAYDRSPTGPSTINLFASVDGGSFTSIFVDTVIDVSGETNSIDLTASALDFGGINDVTFRLFGWGASSSAGTFDLETGNVGNGNQFGLSILGVVPLPAGLPLLAGGLALLGLTRRKA